MMSYKVHKIKLLEDYCDAVLSGEKTFEVRKNDRGYQKGDHISFIPVDRNYRQFFHRVCENEYAITYVHSGLGLKNGYVVLGIEALSSMKGSTIDDEEVYCNRDLCLSMNSCEECPAKDDDERKRESRRAFYLKGIEE
jgi:hypothetical protein